MSTAEAESAQPDDDEDTQPASGVGKVPEPRPSQHPRAVAERRRQAVAEARASGASWQEAADIAGYANKSGAMRALRTWNRPLDDIDRDIIRNTTIDQLDQVLKVALDELTTKRNISAGQLARAAIETKAKIMGLAEPVRVESTIVHVDAVQWLKELIR